MLKVGLAGQIATGKSVVAEVFKKLGAEVVSGDLIGKDVIENNPQLLKELQEVFGAEIVDTSGRLIRSKLGNLVFSDPEKMIKFNRMVHPLLLEKLRSRIAELEKDQTIKMIVVDAALIFNWGLERDLDYTIAVVSDQKNQIKRLEQKGLTAKEAENRIASQIPQDLQAEIADAILTNNNSLEQLQQKAQEVFEYLMKTG